MTTMPPPLCPTQMRSNGLAAEQRQLPIGDAVWVARSRRQSGVEYVLDYCLERKSVHDLASSIITTRYERQKVCVCVGGWMCAEGSRQMGCWFAV